MSDKKQFAIVMLVSAGFVLWILYGSFEILRLNHKLRQDPILEQYPYSFRVIKQDDGVAVIGALHTNYQSLHDALRLMFPGLMNVPDDSWAMRQAEKEYARMQARAQQLVREWGGFRRIRWQLDENWLRLTRQDLQDGRQTLRNPDLSQR